MQITLDDSITASFTISYNKLNKCVCLPEKVQDKLLLNIPEAIEYNEYSDGTLVCQFASWNELQQEKERVIQQIKEIISGD